MGHMVLKPFFEYRSDRERQSHNRIGGEGRPGRCGLAEDGWDLVIGEPWNDGRDQNANGNSGGSQCRDCGETHLGACSTRLEGPTETRIERRNRETHDCGVERRELRE